MQYHAETPATNILFPVRDDARQQQRLLFLRLGFERHSVLEQVVYQPGIARRVGGELLTALVAAHNLTPLYGHALDIVRLHPLDELRVLDGARRLLAVAEIVEYRHQHHGDDEPQQQILREIVQDVLGYL